MARLELAKVLKKKKLSKRQFALLLGMRYEHVFRLFREGYDPRFSTIAKWAKVLRVKVKDLINENGKGRK